jgi:hypothetical protein
VSTAVSMPPSTPPLNRRVSPASPTSGEACLNDHRGRACRARAPLDDARRRLAAPTVGPAPTADRAHHRLSRMAHHRRRGRRPRDRPTHQPEHCRSVQRERPHRPPGMVGGGSHRGRLAGHRARAVGEHRVGTVPLLVDRGQGRCRVRLDHRRCYHRCTARPYPAAPRAGTAMPARRHRAVRFQARWAHPARRSGTRGRGRTAPPGHSTGGRPRRECSTRCPAPGRRSARPARR